MIDFALIEVGHTCMALGALAGLLSASNKRYLCWVFVMGNVMEYAIYYVYVYYGVLESHWELFYLGIALIDLSMLSLMTYCYHRDYILVYPLIFLMVCVNAIISPLWILMESNYIWSISEDALHGLNFALLLILFGRSDGALRVLENFYTTSMGQSMVRVFQLSRNLLQLGMRSKNTEMAEK